MDINEIVEKIGKTPTYINVTGKITVLNSEQDKLIVPLVLGVVQDNIEFILEHNTSVLIPREILVGSLGSAKTLFLSGYKAIFFPDVIKADDWDAFIESFPQATYTYFYADILTEKILSSIP